MDDIEAELAARGAAIDAPKPAHGSFNRALYAMGQTIGTPLWDPDRARAWLAKCVPHGAGETYLFHNAACLYLALGDRDAAIRMVAGAVLYQYPKLTALWADPDLAPLHEDPRYVLLRATTTTKDAMVRDIFAGIDRTTRPPPMPRNAELEAAIEADPTSVEPYVVYGDWLQERGDPRGQLIAIQRALRDRPDDVELVRAEREYLATHGFALMGDLALPTLDHDGTRDAKDLAWHLGFVRRATFRYVAYQMQDRHVPSVEELVRAFFASPASRFVRELVLGVEEPGDSHAKCIRAIAEARPSTIRVLRLAEFEFPEDSELSWVELGPLGALWTAMPRLEQVFITAGGFQLGEIDAPELRELAIHTSGLAKANLESIIAARAPKLERLDLWFGSDTYGCDIVAADVAGILDGCHPRLAHLALANAEFTDDLCAMIARSKILPQLRTLDLSKGTMSATGLAALTAAADAFAHLDVLDLGDNHLVDLVVPQLAKRTLAESQREKLDAYPDDDDDGRYVVFGE